MDQQQPHTGADAAKDPGAQNGDQKDRRAVVAEGQKPLRLLPGQGVGLVELPGGFGADGVSSQQAQHQGGAAGASDPEQGLHKTREHRGRQVSKAHGQ